MSEPRRGWSCLWAGMMAGDSSHTRTAHTHTTPTTPPPACLPTSILIKLCLEPAHSHTRVLAASFWLHDEPPRRLPLLLASPSLLTAAQRIQCLREPTTRSLSERVSDVSASHVACPSRPVPSTEQPPASLSTDIQTHTTTQTKQQPFLSHVEHIDWAFLWQPYPYRPLQSLPRPCPLDERLCLATPMWPIRP